MPMNGHHRAGLKGVKHPLALVVGGVAQVVIHPQSGRGFGLSSQGVEEFFVNKHN